MIKRHLDSFDRMVLREISAQEWPLSRAAIQYLPSLASYSSVRVNRLIDRLVEAGHLLVGSDGRYLVGDETKRLLGC